MGRQEVCLSSPLFASFTSKQRDLTEACNHQSFRKRRRRRRRRQARRQEQNSETFQPVTILLCDEFAVRMKNHTFELKSLIESTDNGGLVYTDLDLFKTMLDIQLCSGSHKMLSLPNAGGSSVVSEAMSCELLHRCYGAQLIKVSFAVEKIFYLDD